MASGTLTAITASIDDIDTTDALEVVEAYQKVFVVNGENLKVADFANVELTHAALATAHAHGDIITQAISNASMVVDFTNTTKTKTYGTQISTDDFNTSNEITGSGSGTAFTPTAVDTGVIGGGQPHWYDWTVYPGGSYGTMPDIAYLVALYRGRLVLSGNSTFPYQWYMTRQNNPWDFAYVANDAQSPVAGGNSEAGQLGDIIRALIPFRDEYLFFGCANSMWVLRGDPADGGTLDCLDKSVGCFGSRSWCFDGIGNMYFMSKDSLCMVPVGLGGVQNLTQLVLPNFTQDLNLDPTYHRVEMEYDRDYHGILITITTLQDGTNTNFWYDLKTNGFFPESYPDVCGVYSLFYYPSNDDSLRRLLVGCTDGYIRNFEASAKSDATTNGTTAIDSSVTLPVITPEDNDDTVKLTSVTVTAAGGASSGDASDTDGVDLELYKGDDAEEVIETINDGDTPFSTKTITGPGRANRIRTRCRGHAVALRLHNNTLDETWAVDRVAADLKETGG